MPILKKDADSAAVLAAVGQLESALQAAGIRAKVDAGSEKTPGWKFNYWEMKGVPVRVEVRSLRPALAGTGGWLGRPGPRLGPLSGWAGQSWGLGAGQARVLRSREG